MTDRLEKPNISDSLFKMDGLSLTTTACHGPYVNYTVSDIPERHPLRPPTFAAKTPPIIRKLCLAALYDVESNIQYDGDRRYFVAAGRGRGFRGMIFIRDVSFSGLLGLNAWYPEVMADSFDYMRAKMLEVGTRNPPSHKMRGFPQFEIEPGTLREFTERHNMTPFARWTDGANAIWAMEDLLRKTEADTESRRRIYNFGQRMYETCFDHLYDEADGLYFGQAAFVDIGHTGYPEEFGRNRGGVETEESPAIYSRSLRIKATSTNCLHVAAFAAMRRLASDLGFAEEAKQWDDKRLRLIEAIKAQLRFADGTLTYFKHEDGHLEPRQHALGTAFAILSGTLEGDEARQAIQDYPVLSYGVPLHHPFFDNDERYHNNAAWPFVDNFFLMAREKATGESEARRRLALLAGAFSEGSFSERAYFKGERANVQGIAQLWSAAPVIDAVKAAGFAS